MKFPAMDLPFLKGQTNGKRNTDLALRQWEIIAR